MPIQTLGIIYQSPKIIATLVIHPAVYLSERMEWKAVLGMRVTCKTGWNFCSEEQKNKPPPSLKSPISMPCLTPLSKGFFGFAPTTQPQTLGVQEHCGVAVHCMAKLRIDFCRSYQGSDGHHGGITDALNGSGIESLSFNKCFLINVYRYQLNMHAARVEEIV